MIEIIVQQHLSFSTPPSFIKGLCRRHLLKFTIDDLWQADRLSLSPHVVVDSRVGSLEYCKVKWQEHRQAKEAGRYRRHIFSRIAHLSANVDHCLLKAISFLHSSGVFVANRSMSLSATDSCDCLRVTIGSGVLAFDVDASALLLVLSSAC